MVNEKNGNIKRKICTEKCIDTSLKTISIVLPWLTFIFMFLPFSVLRNLVL